MSTCKGIPLNEILNSPLAKKKDQVKGMDELAALAAEVAPKTSKKGGESKILISKRTADVSIEIALNDVADMPAALAAVGYQKPGLIRRFLQWVI
jgi:hypothetical protein